MYQLAHQSREAMKAKARRLAGAKDTKVDSSNWTPAEPLNADAKTGMRPIRDREYTKGGKIERKARKSGGRVETEAKDEAKEFVNRDVKAANEARAGKKHVGGMKDGGRNWIKGAIKKPGALHKALDVPKGEKIPEKKLEKAEAKGGKLGKRAQLAETLRSFNKKAGGKVKKEGGGWLDNIANSLAGRGYVNGETWEKPSSNTVATDAAEDKMDTLSPAQARRELAMGRQNMRSGKMDRISRAQADKELAMGRQNMKTDKLSPSQAKSELAMNPDLRGRQLTAENPATGAFFKKGGKAEARKARATGGRTKGKTNISINILAGGKGMPGAPVGGPASAVGAPAPMPPVPMPMGMPGNVDPNMPRGIPENVQSPAARGAPMALKTGGRAVRSYKDMTAGSESGEGRLQKTELQKNKRRA